MLGIVLHHIHNNLGYHSPILSSMGFLTTSLFFFISGYGNMLSINKSSRTEITWLTKKIVKIYLPFFVAYWIGYLISYFLYPQLCPSGLDMLIDIFTVSLPGQISWFPKIILLCFALQWIAKKLFSNIVYQNASILLIVLVYMVVMWKTGQSAFWYNSVICYPLGCIFAKTKVFGKILSKFKDKKFISMIVSVLLFGATVVLSKKLEILKFISPIFFSLGCYYFSLIFNVKTKLFSWIGNNSFEFYIFHIISYQAFAKLISVNKYLYTLLVFVGTFVLVYVYLFVNRKIQALRKRKK